MIKKLFIKNYQNTNDKEVRIKYGKVAGIFGIVTNSILGIIKLVIGYLTHSVSIMADAINNISDMLSSILTIIGFKLSSKKADKEHPYGHARYEYLFTFIISILMINMGIIFLKESIVKIIKPVNLNISYITFVILIVSILLKLSQMFVYLDFSKSIKSNTLKTNAIDTRNDIITTTVILISMIIMKLFNINIDGILGVMVSIFVIYSSIMLLIEAVQPLIGIKPSKEQVNGIKKKILAHDYVLGVHDLMIHNYGVGNDFVSVHVEIDSKLSLIEAHDLIDEIENDFKEHTDMLLTIHMDPVIVGDKKIEKLRIKILDTLKKLNKNIDIHDFRFVEGKNKSKILFDCVLPFECDYTYKEIIKFLNENIKENYEYYVEIDRPYC